MTNKGCIAYANSYIDTIDGRYFVKNSTLEIGEKISDGNSLIKVKIAVGLDIEEEETIEKDNIHFYGRIGERS